MIAKKRIAILIRETTSLLSLTLETNKYSLDCSIIFLLSEKTKTQNKRWMGFILIATSTLMTAVTNTWSFQCIEWSWQETKDPINVLSFKKSLLFSLFYFLLILFHGCSLVEDFNNFRLCGSAASHANTKLPAAKYVVRKFRLLKAIEPALALWFWEWKKNNNK